MRETVDDKIIYTPDQLNTFFATPQTVRPSNIDFDSAYDSPTEEFSFINTFELEVYNVIHQIRSNASGADGVPIKLLKIILPKILPYVSQRRGNYQKSWTNNPGSLSDYRYISILPALSKAMEIIMRNQITGHIERNGMMGRLQSGFRSNHSPPKNNE
jgi:hypothetical protein